MQDKNDNLSEKRQYTRINKHFILTYYDLADPNKKHEASQLKNISVGGMCLITAQYFKTGDRLAIALKTPFLSELTHLEATVLESKEKIRDIIYQTRVQFDELDDQAKLIIEKTVLHFEKESDEYDE